MIISIVILIILILILIINFYMIVRTKNRILTSEKLKDEDGIDCILVLGAGVKNNKPTNMLEDRILQGIYIYNDKITSKIIMSGDHGRKEYDEVNIMKNYAKQRGVNSENIFMDHAGFSTYESLYRAKEIFETKKIVIVTQEYHLYRALYIAKALGIQAYGISSNLRIYTGQLIRELRELIARFKEFFKCIIKPNPTCLGEKIPINGNGDITNDKE
jgi:SanA protein